jgi:hypothetical protein
MFTILFIITVSLRKPGIRTWPSSRRDTPLYRAVQNHLETFLALCHDDWEDERISPHAERELRAYLECGILAYG